MTSASCDHRSVPAQDVAAAFPAGSVVHFDGRCTSVTEALSLHGSLSRLCLVCGLVLVGDTGTNAVVDEITLASARRRRRSRHGVRISALLLGRLKRRAGRC